MVIPAIEVPVQRANRDAAEVCQFFACGAAFFFQRRYDLGELVLCDAAHRKIACCRQAFRFMSVIDRFQFVVNIVARFGPDGVREHNLTMNWRAFVVDKLVREVHKRAKFCAADEWTSQPSPPPGKAACRCRPLPAAWWTRGRSVDAALRLVYMVD